MSTIESFIVNILIKQKNYTQLDQAKIRFGVRLIFADLCKFLIVYGAAFLLDCVLPTFVTHITFYTLRQKSFGYHFSSSFSCIAWSVLAFPIMSACLAALPLPLWLVWSTGIFSATTVFLYAPVGTAKQPIINEKHRLYLRKQAHTRLLTTGIITCTIPIYIHKFIVLGVAIQSLALLIQKFKGEKSL
ncbi:accessory gene regulator ArgB-like protein [Bacillus xiapuensis]|uniref:accessory gene regulator ArgB-like protein n=1 Tax=Bacillus xiapuensis TaxID=2014075 RepID=UPI000C2363AD|nr:accessory gene regulator B family protein [Bacillus xiapuensis]